MRRKPDIALYFFTKFVPFIIGALFLSCNNDSPDLEQEYNNEPFVAEAVPFSNVPTLEKMVIYEVNFMAFNPSFDFAAVESKLDHIKNLGVNVLWLMPIHPEGIQSAVGSPYCVQDYRDVNPEFGSLNDFKQLVEAAHKKDIAVIIDWVANHTAWDHEWVDFDGWHTTDDQGNIIIPPGTNWQDVAELNFDNEDMQAEMITSMKFWIDEYNIDGFRCDAVDFVPYSFWKQALDSLKAYDDRDLILLGESGKTQSLKAGFQMIYGWDYQHKLKTIFSNNEHAHGLFSTHNAEKTGFSSEKARLRYITNHDICAWEEAPTKAYVNKQGTVAAFAITTMMGEVPLIYTGQEIAHPSQISFFDENPINWDINPEVYEAHKQIIQAKLDNRDLVQKPAQTINHDDLIAFTKLNETDQLLFVCNVRNQNIQFEIPNEIKGSWNNLTVGTELILSETILLKPFEYLILKK